VTIRNEVMLLGVAVDHMKLLTTFSAGEVEGVHRHAVRTVM
jgi:hypothetical protein